MTLSERAKYIKGIVEGFLKQFKTKKELQQRAMNVSRLNEFQGEVIFSKIEKIEKEQKLFIEVMSMLENESILRRDKIIIRSKIKGQSHKAIGETHGISDERVRQILNELYEYIASNIKW